MPRPPNLGEAGFAEQHLAAVSPFVGAEAVYSYEPEPTNFACLTHFAETARYRGR